MNHLKDHKRDDPRMEQVGDNIAVRNLPIDKIHTVMMKIRNLTSEIFLAVLKLFFFNPLYMEVISEVN